MTRAITGPANTPADTSTANPVTTPVTCAVTGEASGLPEGWDITTVEIVETTTYRVHVAHPPGAAPDDVAAAGYADYCQAEHPEATFPHVPGPDHVTVARCPDQITGREHQTDRADRSDWTAQRPDHDTVVAILQAGPGTRDRAE